jgi:hypothetical protein
MKMLHDMKATKTMARVMLLSLIVACLNGNVNASLMFLNTQILRETSTF